MAEQYENVDFILDNEQPGTDTPVAIEDFDGGSDTSGTDSTTTTEVTLGVEAAHFTSVKIGESSGTSDGESGDIIEASPSPSTSETSLTGTALDPDITRAHNAAKFAREAAEATWTVVGQIEDATKDTENRPTSCCYRLEFFLQRKYRSNYISLQNKYKSKTTQVELVGREVTDAHYEAEQAADAADRAETELSNATDPDEFETIRNRVLPVIDNAEEIGIRAFEKEYKGLKALKKYMTEVSTPADWQDVDTLYRCSCLDAFFLVLFIIGWIIIGVAIANFHKRFAESGLTIGIIFIVPGTFLGIVRILRTCTKQKVRKIRDDAIKEIARIEKRLHKLRPTYGNDEDNETRSQPSNEEA